MSSEQKNIRKSICQIAKTLYEKELVDSCGGNISIRDEDKVYIVQRKSGAKYRWQIEEDSIVVTDLCMTEITGDVKNISREAATHYYIYQNFPDINAVIHGHPLYMMVFGSAHIDIPAVTECMRARAGGLGITNIEESLPGSLKQAELIIENFKKRREANSEAPLICNLPFHGAFSAGADIDEAFMLLEIANNCAKLLIFRQLMFGNNSEADFRMHKKFTKEEDETVEQNKEVCIPGYVYKDAFGNEAIYREKGNIHENKILVEKITEEILKQVKKDQI